jgi:hypothetical protein
MACHLSHYLLRDLFLACDSGISDAYYCAECTRLEKDRDGCPKIVNLGASRTDLFYERRRLGGFGSCLRLVIMYLTVFQVSRRAERWSAGKFLHFNY